MAIDVDYICSSRFFTNSNKASKLLEFVYNFTIDTQQLQLKLLKKVRVCQSNVNETFSALIQWTSSTFVSSCVRRETTEKTVVNNKLHKSLRFLILYLMSCYFRHVFSFHIEKYNIEAHACSSKLDYMEITSYFTCVFTQLEASTILRSYTIVFEFHNNIILS